MKSELTRRELAARLPVTFAAPAFAAQRAPDEVDPFQSARKRLSDSVRKVEEFALPMAVEPAFIFKP